MQKEIKSERTFQAVSELGMEQLSRDGNTRVPDSNYELQKWKMLQLRQESMEEEGMGIGMEGPALIARRDMHTSPEDIAKRMMMGADEEPVRRMKSQGIDALELGHEFSENSREVYFYFFVNQGSGGRMAHLLLNMDIDELKFPNYIDKVAFPALSSIKVKIVPLNDPEIRMKRFREVRVLSDRVRSKDRQLTQMIP